MLGLRTNACLYRQKGIKSETKASNIKLLPIKSDEGVYMNIAIITGASSGIGKEFARQIDGKLCRTDEIWLLARRREPMDELAESMQTITRTVVIDITDERELKQFAEVLMIRAPKITLLANCAGTGRHGSFSGQSDEEVAAMLRLNIMALTRLTKICLPYMRKGSKIVQFASGAAFMPQAEFAVYAASKAYVYSFSRALGRELKDRGISVTTVCPGPVDTPFLRQAYADISRMGRLKQMTTKSAACVAANAIEGCKRGRAVAICGLPVKGLYWATQGIENALQKLAETATAP